MALAQEPLAEDTYPRHLVDLAEYERECWTALAAAIDRHRPPERVRVLAACREAATSTFFPDRGANAERARRVCAGCPVLDDCGRWAAQRGPGLDGVWAGLTRADRRGDERASRAKPLTWADGTPRGRW